MVTGDIIARLQILTTGVIFERGVKIWFAPWNSSVHTLEEIWFERKKIWLNLYGPPHHLWIQDKVEVIGRAVGKSYLETDQDCLTLSRLDMMRVKLEFEHPMKRWEAITINGDFKLAVVPTVFQSDLRWDVYEDGHID